MSPISMTRDSFSRYGDKVTMSHRRPLRTKRCNARWRGDFHIIAAFCQAEIIGGLTAYELEMYTENATELFIYEVGVEEDFRRRGIGRALFEAAKVLCRARGLSVIHVPVYADDARAVAFYQGIGLKREDVAWFSHEFEYSK